MKKGKNVKLNLFKDAKCSYGTVDSTNFKSIYLVLQTWVEPRLECDNWERIAGVMKRDLLHTLLDINNKDVFESNQILDLDLRTSGIQRNKKSFMSLELTLFVSDPLLEFKSSTIKHNVKNLLEHIYYENLKRSKYFSLHMSKDN
jgi:hypothetical protein